MPAAVLMECLDMKAALLRCQETMVQPLMSDLSGLCLELFMIDIAPNPTCLKEALYNISESRILLFPYSAQIISRFIV